MTFNKCNVIFCLWGMVEYYFTLIYPAANNIIINYVFINVFLQNLCWNNGKTSCLLTCILQAYWQFISYKAHIIYLLCISNTPCTNCYNNNKLCIITCKYPKAKPNPNHNHIVSTCYSVLKCRITLLQVHLQIKCNHILS